tara:strand:- start:81 stop:617 length:537 start_codon:yes stop_codon:yes gene_type:complete
MIARTVGINYYRNPMTKKLFKEEFVKFCFGLVATTLAILIALAINSRKDINDDISRYTNVTKAIKYEAIQNEFILRESFEKYFDTDKIIMQKLSSKIAEESLKSDSFMNNASSNEIEILIKYIINLKKANKFRDADEEYKKNEKLYDKFGDSLTWAFFYVIRGTKNSTQDILDKYSNN